MTRASRHPRGGQTASHGELVQRTLSAILLAAVAVLLTFTGQWPFTLMIAAGGVVLAWEWGRLVRGVALDPAFYTHAVSVVTACVITAAGTRPWVPLGVLWAGAAVAALLASAPDKRLWSAFGVLYLGVPCYLLTLFRSDVSYGLAAVLFLFVVVWSADTAAYFTGRALRGPKLAPSISPGKTWSGFAGGLAVPTMLASGFALWLGGTSVLGVALTGAGLALASQIGDLTESAIKRNFHVKDSGHLLPGHGGLFDRVDGLIGAVLAAACVAGLRNTLTPGQALLIWP